MGNSNRAALLTKAHKVLKQHYKPVAASDRPLLEQMLFACCLERASYEAAEKTYASLVDSFFDWNEVRVSSINELSEVMRGLPDPSAAASNLKRVLQSVFEATYSFDLEAIKKEKIGQGIKTIEAFEGITPFVVAFVTQHSLGGHAIPLDQGSADVLYVTGILNEDEAHPGSVAAIERAIPKNKGIEFGSLLHQLGADYTATPHSTNVRNILLAINPDAKDRFPKRAAPKKEAGKTEAAKPEAEADTESARKPKATSSEKKPAAPKKESKPAAESAPKKKPAADAAPAKKSPTKQLTKRKPK